VPEKESKDLKFFGAGPVGYNYKAKVMLAQRPEMHMLAERVDKLTKRGWKIGARPAGYTIKQKVSWCRHYALKARKSSLVSSALRNRKERKAKMNEKALFFVYGTLKVGATTQVASIRFANLYTRQWRKTRACSVYMEISRRWCLAKARYTEKSTNTMM
jgi:hypothetical protein